MPGESEADGTSGAVTSIFGDIVSCDEAVASPFCCGPMSTITMGGISKAMAAVASITLLIPSVFSEVFLISTSPKINRLTVYNLHARLAQTMPRAKELVGIQLATN